MIAFVGLSHLGLLYATATAAKGFKVAGFDSSEALCEELCNARLPVSEPGLPELFERNRERLDFTADFSQLKECSLVFFALDVPTDSESRSDLSPLVALLEQGAGHLAPNATVVILSQVPPGFTRPISKGVLSGVRTVFYQVETLVFGSAVERAMNPERYIVGCQDPAAGFPALYGKWLEAFGCPVLPMRLESAELAKIAINLFLVSSVSTTNTLAEICEQIGADWGEIAPALRLDRRIGAHAYLSPGLGIAGGNLERDLCTVQQLAAQHGTEAGIISAWQLNSRYRRDWALRLLHRIVLSQSPDVRLAWWGLAYKQDTHSIKNSPSLALAEALGAYLKVGYDPQVKSLKKGVRNLELAATALDACCDATALVVMTPWREFRDIDLRRVRDLMRGNILIDPYGVLDAEACLAAGFRYFKLGS